MYVTTILTVIVTVKGMLIMCPFFDDVGALVNHEYTEGCVFRIGEEGGDSGGDAKGLYSYITSPRAIFVCNYILWCVYVCFSSVVCVCPGSEHFQLLGVGEDLSTYLSGTVLRLFDAVHVLLEAIPCGTSSYAMLITDIH